MIGSPYAKAVSIGRAIAIATATAGAIALQACQTSNAPATEPSPLPMSDIAIPKGGVAVFFGRRDCCNLVTVAPDGAVSYELGSMVRKQSLDSAHPQWEWRRAPGTLPTQTSIGSIAARNFISTTDEIPSTYLYPDPYWNRAVHSGMDRQTVYGVIRNGVVFYDDYHGQQDAVFRFLGMEGLGLPSPTQTMAMPSIPSDAVGFEYNTTFYIVYRSGRVTEQIEDDFSRPTPAVYEVEPISRELAWRIVTFAPTVWILPGCPGLDDPSSYHALFIVTNDHISNGLYCHRFAPMREELMSVVDRE